MVWLSVLKKVFDNTCYYPIKASSLMVELLTVNELVIGSNPI